MERSPNIQNVIGKFDEIKNKKKKNFGAWKISTIKHKLYQKLIGF